MKELIEQIITYIPTYLLTLGKLVARPKTFLAQTQPDTDVGFRSGLQFLSVSIVLFSIAVTPVVPKASDIWTRVATVAVLLLLGNASMACALRLAWRIVGGRSHVSVFLYSFAYTASVGMLFAITALISAGAAKSFDQTQYEVISQAASTHAPIQDEATISGAAVAMAVGYLCGQIASTAWVVATWGAFRALNATTRNQSVGAFVLTLAFGWPLLFAVSLITRIMDSIL